MNQRPTIEDVARLAGVSTATVSRALHEPAKVSADTATRVHAAVRDIGYTLNIAAQTLRQRRSNALLVVVPNIGNTFYGEVLAGIEAAAHAAGQTILIADSAQDAGREAAYLAWLRNGRADGVFLMARPEVDWSTVAPVPETGLRPVVMISEPPVIPGTPWVTIDHQAGAQEITTHLIAMGHRRIAHVTGPDTTGLRSTRLNGYLAALAAAGLPADPSHIIPGDFSADSGARAADALLALIPRPTAVFCANDEMAMGLIGALARRGVRVPLDISVAGFDDIQFAACFVPAITTIRQPRRAMGEAAVALMHRLLGRDGADMTAPVQQVLPHDLVLRDSVGPPPP
jgi:LacI family transcriptional regulator, repressor for deo operon, udp, cdd, tsx, nupC, and nupG